MVIIGCVKTRTKASNDSRSQEANHCHINRIQTWALEEARRRLEAEGILEDPTQKK